MLFSTLRALDDASDASTAVRSVRRNLVLFVAVAIAGTLLALGVGAVALTSTYRSLQAADRAAGALRLHLEVDLLHDALRDDVLSAALGLETAHHDFDGHVREMEDNLRQLEGMSLPGPIRTALLQQAGPLRIYVDKARAARQLAGAAGRNDLEAFGVVWRDLEQPIDAVTDQLRAEAARAEASGRRSFTNGLVVLALGFVGIAGGLLVAGRRIARAVLETNQQLAAAMQSAEKAGQSRADFLAAMSHEIRTPMTGVLGMVDLLAAEDLPDRQRGYVETLRTSGRHLLNVINDILDFTRIESGLLEMEKIDFSLPEVLERLRSLVHPLAIERGLELDLRLAPHSPPVLRGDPTRIQQVLLNLVTNAIKFTEHGSVRVLVAQMEQARREGAASRYRFEVRDTGIGIAPERVAELFSAFRQADESIARRYGGSGLGLAICKRLVEAMGGTLGAESTPGFGSVFFFELPLELGDVAALPVRIDAQHPAASPRRILVAEDVEVNRDILRATLQRAGHSVQFARDGAEAVALAQAEPFDLVLMDVQMPVMDGIEATRRIRKLAAPVRDIPILALTANVMAQERDRYLAAGMNECLTKPIDWDQLFAAIARHGGSEAVAQPAPAASRAGALLDDAVLETLERMAGRAELRKWLRSGLDSYGVSLEAMADPSAVVAEAHKMRGSSGTLGLEQVRALASQLEAAGVATPAQRTALRQAVADSEAALRERGLV